MSSSENRKDENGPAFDQEYIKELEDFFSRIDIEEFTVGVTDASRLAYLIGLGRKCQAAGLLPPIIEL